MNKIAIVLFVVGGLAILGGIVIGFTAYETPQPGYEFITDKNYTILFAWIGGGLISGIMMFGFAEIIRLLDVQKETLRKMVGDNHQEIASQKEKGRFDKFMDDVENARNN
ncbi:hypothetical protein M3E13_05455 [Oceanobacillus kimchii]|uniref:hypothetical protein n=1 Tax=Oceanobacillus kimchii TaxID=746691 RepID=UPI0021A78969|nr:hypothetical protein [Oceanobacillus kimchii]MCT1575721.1 hypothetical protein [Oceanobacillus kimchii]MCT2135358.1 hypothetical protein [Oceanobacillus kimchii]